MTLKRFDLKPGVDRQKTSYQSRGGWYDGNHIRFRSGQPTKIGGWERLSATTFLGVSRTLFNWATLGGLNIVGVGTHLKFYIENGGVYYDVTPLRDTVVLNNPFGTTDGDATVLVTDVAHGAYTGDYVTFSGAAAVGGLTLNGEYSITKLTDDTYNIEAASNASATVAAGGGAAVTAAYQLHIQNELAVPIVGFGAGPYGTGPWGVGSVTAGNIGMWSQSNFGEDLLFNQFNGQLCIWDASAGTSVRATLLEDAITASDVPIAAYLTLVSDTSRIAMAFGTNEIGSSTLDPMLIRWSGKEDATNWTPDATNEAGSIRLSLGSEIVAAVQARQEVLVWTDAAVYGMQYLGAPEVWGVQILGDNISIVGPLAVIYANGVAYWMGKGRFYRYDGTVLPINCTVDEYVFGDFNSEQQAQVVCGTHEEFNEIWWFYPSEGSTQLDKYVVYNYMDDIWYYGETGRTAWIDSKLRNKPLAATYSNNLVYHEIGCDDNTTGTPVAIIAFATSAQFDIEDGQNFAFCWRMLPDLKFTGSTAANPIVTFSLTPLQNSGSGYTSPASIGGTTTATSTLTLSVPLEEYTGQLNLRLRGRQLVMKVESTMIGAAWQLGAVRLDLRPDGRR